MNVRELLFTFEKRKLPSIVVFTTMLLIAILVGGAAIRVLLALFF